jgi:hypothetical protein
MFGWVSSNFVGRNKLVIFESGGVDGLTGWESLFELSNSSNGSDHASECFLWALILDSCFKLLECSVEDKKGFIFISDAFKKSKKIKFSSESLQDSLFDLSKL